MPIPKTFTLHVPHVGTFECRRRVMRTAVQIAAEFNRLVEGDPNPPPYFAELCNFLAYLKVMIVAGPDGWDVDNVDPESEAEMTALREVYEAMTAEEARFRRDAGADPASAGAGPEPADHVVVSEPLPADGA